MSDLVGNPEDRFSRVEAHNIQILVYEKNINGMFILSYPGYYVVLFKILIDL